MEESKAINEVIIGYRKLIEDRYQYQRLKAKYDMPISFDEVRLNRFRDYFLEYIYPSIQKRSELNEVFENLDNYIKEPEKLASLLLESGRLIFKYGLHLPKFLMAGLKALRSFRTANAFEKKLARAAIDGRIVPPFGQAKIEGLISTLPYKDIDAFIESGEALFNLLYDRELVQKIQDIIGELIGKMKKKPKLFRPDEIDGLAMGLEMIEKGNQLFEELTEKEQKIIFKFVVEVERGELDELFNH